MVVATTASTVKLPAHERRLLPLLATAQLMLVLDVTVVNVALPDMSVSLGLGQAATAWALTTYTVAFGGLMLLGGRLVDVFGSRRQIVVGLLLFVVASGICAASGSMSELLLGRALQGVGGALLSPAALAAATEGPDRSRALRVWSSLSGAGAAAGVLLGGLLTAGPGWRWVFLVNVPIGLLLLAFLAPWLRQPAPRRAIRLDVPGSLLVTLAAGTTVFWLVSAGAYGWADPRCWAVLLGSLATWLVLTKVESRAREPLLRLDLLTDRRVAAGALLMVLATGLLVGGFFLGSFTLQDADGFSALAVGLAFLPMTVVLVAGAHLTGQYLARADTRTTTVVGLTLAGCGYGIAWGWSSPAAVITGLAVSGAGAGCLFVTAFSCALAHVPADEAGLRSGLINTFHELGGALGVAALTTVAGHGLTSGHAQGLRNAYGAGAVTALVVAVAAAAVMPRLRTSTDAPIH